MATGWLDGQLSARGRALATELGRRRRNDALTAVFASGLGRAVETVELAFGGSDVPVYLDARLRECDDGAWNGMPVARLACERAQRLSRPFPDGESYLQVVARVASFLEELARDWDGTRVLVVGHSATRWALDHLLAGAALHSSQMGMTRVPMLVLSISASTSSPPTKVASMPRPLPGPDPSRRVKPTSSPAAGHPSVPPGWLQSGGPQVRSAQALAGVTILHGPARCPATTVKRRRLGDRHGSSSSRLAC